MSHSAWGSPTPSEPAASGSAQPPPGPRTLLLGLSVGLALLLVAITAVGCGLSASEPEPTASGASATPPRSTTSASATRTVGGAANRPATAAAPSLQVPKPSAKPRARRSPSLPTTRRPATGLKVNSLYLVKLTGSGTCRAKVRRAKPPLKNSALAPYLRTVVGCLVDTFRAPLSRQGFSLTTPKVKTFKRSIKTPCGKLGAKTNPAFYCAGTIYWPVSSDDGREAYTYARLGYVGLTAHEFGHHLQASTGMLYDYGVRYSEASPKQRLALSRRLELQAQCFEGVFLSHQRSALKVSGRDRSQLKTWHSYTGDEDPPSSRRPDHGSSKAQFGWLDRGLASADFGRCNTWAATAKSVR